MSSIKYTLTLTEEESKKVERMAKDKAVSVQQYIKLCIFGNDYPEVIFTPPEAVRRALLYPHGTTFSLPSLYGDAWTLKRGAAGVFGKRFYNYVDVEKATDEIKFVGMKGNLAYYERV